jgi:hypothetical protein
MLIAVLFVIEEGVEISTYLETEKFKEPAFKLLNVGLFIKVPSLPFPLRSLQTFPVPG